ncbi:MAG: ester cyclase [Pseudorhodoplanes sp.]|uniref:ester cyclase n=1 Tax=Pseudorhodoplanes sp. TaxID=1934341 RepID=UPI003D142C04
MTILAQRNRALVEAFLDGTHSGNLSVIDTTVATDIVTHGFPCGHNPASRGEYKQFFAEFGRSFSNMNYRTLALTADENCVAARFLVEVDHTGDYLGVPPSGKRVSFTGMALYRIQNGMIAETWLHLDGLSFLGQIGAIVPRAA